MARALSTKGDPKLAELARASHAARQSGASVAELATGTAKAVPLSRATQERLALRGGKPDSKAVLNAQRSATRDATGKSFQADLDATISAFAQKGYGFIQRHGPEAKRIRGALGEWTWTVRKGGAPCDYSGHVNAFAQQLVAGFTYYRGTVADHMSDMIPVVFDAKVLGASAATYEHERERLHQILTLRDAARCGAYAFLLVHVRKIDAAVLIGPAYFEALLSGQGVKLFETTGAGDVVGNVTARSKADRGNLLLPWHTYRPVPDPKPTVARAVRLFLPAVPYTPGVGWDFVPALGFVDPANPNPYPKP